MLNDTRPVRKSFLFFEPSLQEGDHQAIEGHHHSTLTLADGPVEINIPKGVNAVMIQAISQGINYTLSGTDPTAASGFFITAGAAPVVIPVSGRTKLKVHAAADTVRLEIQFGVI